MCLPLGGSPTSAYTNSGWGNPGGAIPVGAAYNGQGGLVVWGTFGSNTVNLVHAGDYRCGYTACTIGQGWIYS